MLFDEVNPWNSRGNCYGVIGANGAGKSTFLKILSGDIDPSRGQVSLETGKRMACCARTTTSLMRCQWLTRWWWGQQTVAGDEGEGCHLREAWFSGRMVLRLATQAEFAEMGGWTRWAMRLRLLSGPALARMSNYKLMRELSGNHKVRVRWRKLSMVIRIFWFWMNRPTTWT